jgi:Tfp pilus assembly protein PilX
MSPRHLAAEERGLAVPIALAILFMVAGLAMVSAREAIVSQTQSFRDRNVKRALQAAQAGLETAVYETNLMQPGSQQCATKAAPGAQLAISSLQADGWCPSQSEDLGDGATYAMRISGAQSLHVNGQALVERTVVSSGSVNGVRRRVSQRITAATGEPVFAFGYAGLSLTAVDFGNNVNVTGGLGSNGDVRLKNYAEVCGAVTPGPGKATTIQNNAHVCSGYPTDSGTTSFNLQPVDQGNAQTVNDNDRIGNPPGPTSADPCSSCGDVDWNPSTRVLKLTNNATLTLGGNVYSLCRLDLDNTAQLKIAARAPGTAVRIYVDSPEACGGGSGMGSVSVRNNSSIVNLNSDPTTLQLYVVGSPTKATEVNLSNGVNVETEMIMAIYAPYSTVTLDNNVSLTGAIAARLLVMQNNASLTYSDRIADITTGSPVRLYRNEEYVECANDQTGTAPASGC